MKGTERTAPWSWMAARRAEGLRGLSVCRQVHPPKGARPSWPQRPKRSTAKPKS
jgi:hypothetical protein